MFDAPVRVACTRTRPVSAATGSRRHRMREALNIDRRRFCCAAAV